MCLSQSTVINFDQELWGNRRNGLQIKHSTHVNQEYTTNTLLNGKMNCGQHFVILLLSFYVFPETLKFS
jgi:hypothetical protein